MIAIDLKIKYYLIIKQKTIFKVVQALGILLKFRLISFKPTTYNENVAEYSLITERVLFLLRYSRYVALIQTKFGHTSALLTEELLRSGTQIASQIIIKALANVENKEEKENMIEFRDRFHDLVKSNYFIRAPSSTATPTSAAVPKFSIDQMDLFSCPDIEIQDLIDLKKAKNMSTVKTSDVEIYWYVNFERFHQEFRDVIMVSAIERKIDTNAGECLRFILLQMYAKTDPWQQVSNPISYVEIKQACDKKSNNIEMLRYLDQYILTIRKIFLMILP